MKKWGLVPGVGTGPPTGLRQWTRQHFARTRRGCLPSFYRVLSQRELTSVASCAASEKVVIFHQPTFPFTRFPTATYPHRPQARKGPFLMIAITFPIHDRSHTAKRRFRIGVRSRSNSCSPRFDLHSGNPPTPDHRDISLQALSGALSSLASSGPQGWK